MRAKALLCLVIKINQRFHQELFSQTTTGALKLTETDSSLI